MRRVFASILTRLTVDECGPCPPTGLYDLNSEGARKTGQAENGIGQVLRYELPAGAAYLRLVRSMNPENESLVPPPERRGIIFVDPPRSTAFFSADIEQLKSHVRS